MIAPLHTDGPVAVSQDGTRLFTCVGEEALMTDLRDGKELCRFLGVRRVLHSVISMQFDTSFRTPNLSLRFA